MFEYMLNTHNELIIHKTEALRIVPTTEEGLLPQSLLGGKKILQKLQYPVRVASRSLTPD